MIAFGNRFYCHKRLLMLGFAKIIFQELQITTSSGLRVRTTCGYPIFPQKTRDAPQYLRPALSHHNRLVAGE
ncbi:MAG: hypothetical protein DMG95_09345 [Acidobacteria bacterium]|nr:MAG: hypothetical protein DMG95_09345 [Acidobacteriota bacterium]